MAQWHHSNFQWLHVNGFASWILPSLFKTKTMLFLLLTSYFLLQAEPLIPHLLSSSITYMFNINLVLSNCGNSSLKIKLTSKSCLSCTSFVLMDRCTWRMMVCVRVYVCLNIYIYIYMQTFRPANPLEMLKLKQCYISMIMTPTIFNETLPTKTLVLHSRCSWII